MGQVLKIVYNTFILSFRYKVDNWEFNSCFYQLAAFKEPGWSHIKTSNWVIKHQCPNNIHTRLKCKSYSGYLKLHGTCLKEFEVEPAPYDWEVEHIKDMWVFSFCIGCNCKKKSGHII